ncbi:serine/threonine-protein kinase [Luteolibacter luteus]|uniref:Serine/threonine protein kinase n=1 Tax=Luteolibacter luteus TaxID=2728835 RepID=A0A858RKE6_9BACT|nr:serine/threonine-protein kinase [Luteolibacter luteus]QJE97776.1 serine/threonine protein kinase [Luteolibacter luteus]
MDPSPDPIIEIFNEALGLASSERAAFLEGACGGDAVLLQRLLDLLRSHEGSEGFLDEPVLLLRGGDARVAPIGESAGDLVGRYKLIEQIGEGGCGVVFLAEQQEPVHRQVALKVVKPGMDTRSVIAQFESERQALAMMGHPHIAQVLDAGATDAGRPYFVMELVRGKKITDYCDEHSLTLRGRLELFVQVCHAVQHAHQKGIIHRDIKPSNILVSTTGEGMPFPKVIDFGIAKATAGQQLTDKTFFTAFEMLIGTPTYMSPEQAALKSVDLDTRTDIYSLGVLLYQMLTGAVPFEVRELFNAGLDEVRRDILEKQPLRPSSRLKSLSTGDLEKVAERRQLDPARLSKSVRGDLDWIVMKALEKDRSRRYPTANALAMDVLHHLANEPVNARPPSAAYQLGKLVARNKVLAGSLGVIAVLLVSSLAVMATLFAKEQEARRRADAEKRTALTMAMKSKRVTKVLMDMLVSVSPGVAMGRDTTILRELLDKTDTRITGTLDQHPESEAELRFALGMGYREIGDVESAERMLKRSAELYRKVSPHLDRELGTVLNRLVFLQLNQGKIVEAEPEVLFLQELWRSWPDKEEQEVSKSLEALAMLRWRQGQLGEAEDLMRRVHTWRREHLGATHQDSITAMGNLASILYAGKRYAEADPLFHQVLTESEVKYGPDHPELSGPIWNLFTVSIASGKTAEAKSYLSRVVELRRKYLEPSHPHRADAIVRLGDMNVSTGDRAEAEALYREVIASGRKDPDDYVPVLKAIERLTSNLKQWGKLEEADAVFSGILTPAYCSSPRCVPVLKMRTEFLARAGRWREAAADAAKLIEFQPEEHEYYHTLAPLLVAEGRNEDYRKLCAEIIRRCHEPTDIFIADRMAKDCLIRPDALPDLERVALFADAVFRQGEGYDQWPLFQVLKALSDWRQMKFAEAAALAGKVDHSNPHAKVAALAIQAMAAFRQNEGARARAYLAEGDALFEAKLPKLASADLGQDWRDWIIARELLSEARALAEAGRE